MFLMVRSFLAASKTVELDFMFFRKRDVVPTKERKDEKASSGIAPQVKGFAKTWHPWQ
jgi:hypothetical protein